jgi:nucleoside-diphosphate-sugar epimerase
MDRSPSDLCNEPLKVCDPCFPRTDYGKSKLRAEESIVESSLPYTIFRPGYVYGRGMRTGSHLRKFAQLIRKGVPLHRIGFPGKISLIHVDDLAHAILKCVTTDLGLNCTYLAETEYLSMGDALSLLGESLFGKRSLQLRLPSFKYFFQSMHSRLPVIFSGLFLGYYWMDDPVFREQFFTENNQKLISRNVGDITNGGDKL